MKIYKKNISVMKEKHLIVFYAYHETWPTVLIVSE